VGSRAPVATRWRRVPGLPIIQPSQTDVGSETRSKEHPMFNTTTVLTTRLASFAIALTMTLAMLMSINSLATSDAHADALATTPAVATQSVQV
jgi:hypothetical protein